MKLSNEMLSIHRQDLLEKGYELPQYDRKVVLSNTMARPEWVHFGAGNIFRAFIAALDQSLLNAGIEDTGIIAAEGFDSETLDAAYRPFDNLCVSATLCADGRIQKSIIGSVVRTLGMNPGTEDLEELKLVFRNPSLKMASLTITEKGYNIKDGRGELFPAVAHDMENKPEEASSYIGKVALLIYERYLAGELPIAMVSMDNCSHNGSRLEAAILAFADAWEEKGLCKEGFSAYVRDRSKISFPWSMIDKITPRPDAAVRAIIEADGIEDMDYKKTSHGSYVAPFVNAEETQYLVIEDAFPNGHPALEKAGVIFTARETVDMVETMKVCTCLNPLHTCLAVCGCLLGFTKISDEMNDPDLKKLVEVVGYKEGLPVVVDPGVIDPKKFIDEVVEKRFPNPFLGDTPQRIATDTSQKITVRFGNTIKKYAASDSLKVEDLKLIAFVIAAWCRYLMAVDDNGEAFTPSDDPLMPMLEPRFASLKLGQEVNVHELLQPILSDERIMGSNLYETGLAKQIEADFSELISGPGAVRRTLKARLAE